jgi:hopanoid-associated phosphorylase
VTLIAVTGLRREAQIVRRPGVMAIAGGGQGACLEAAILAAAADGASGIISIGIAGALAPGLEPGDWVVAEAVIDGETVTETDGPWREQLLSRLADARPGAFLASPAMVTEAAEKRRLHAQSGAIAVDMESHAAARAAKRLGIRLAAARVISDAAGRNLPAAVKVGMRQDGGMALAPVLAALARDPGQLPQLIRTGLDAGAALRALRRAADAWLPPEA